MHGAPTALRVQRIHSEAVPQNVACTKDTVTPLSVTPIHFLRHPSYVPAQPSTHRPALEVKVAWHVRGAADGTVTPLLLLPCRRDASMADQRGIGCTS